MYNSRDLERLSADLGKIPGKTIPAAQAMLTKAALNVKNDARQRISGLAHAPLYPLSIGFDIYTLPFQLRARVGPDKERRQGALGNILELGSVNNPPHPHLLPALQAEEPRFAQYSADLGASLLEDGLR